MPKSGKDIAGKILNFLRENDGKAVINQMKDAARFQCGSSALGYSLRKLIEVGIVKTSKPVKRGSHKPVEFILSDEFREGEIWSWREVLKRKSSGGEAEASSVKISNDACRSEECLRVRKVLLEELVDVHERLKTSQEENQILRSTVWELQGRVRGLEGEIEIKKSACHKLRSDVDKLDSRLRTLRAQTSKPPAAVEKKIRTDGFGVTILPGEGLPDTR